MVVLVGQTTPITALGRGTTRMTTITTDPYRNIPLPAGAVTAQPRCGGVTMRAVLVALLCVAGAAVSAPAAHASPVQWCDPASPLFDPTLCYNESGPHRGYSCDPYGPAYDPNYCAAQR
jgi:hypothetical protein